MSSGQGAVAILEAVSFPVEKAQEPTQSPPGPVSLPLLLLSLPFRPGLSFVLSVSIYLHAVSLCVVIAKLVLVGTAEGSSGGACHLQYFWTAA